MQRNRGEIWIQQLQGIAARPHGLDKDGDGIGCEK
ncbi:MAG: excalibur calcium-binding domain-containing protein [Nitrososphaerota archaeon]